MVRAPRRCAARAVRLRRRMPCRAARHAARPPRPADTSAGAGCCGVVNGDRGIGSSGRTGTAAHTDGRAGGGRGEAPAVRMGVPVRWRRGATGAADGKRQSADASAWLADAPLQLLWLVPRENSAERAQVAPSCCQPPAQQHLLTNRVQVPLAMHVPVPACADNPISLDDANRIAAVRNYCANTAVDPCSKWNAIRAEYGRVQFCLRDVATACAAAVRRFPDCSCIPPATTTCLRHAHTYVTHAHSFPQLLACSDAVRGAYVATAHEVVEMQRTCMDHEAQFFAWMDSVEQLQLREDPTSLNPSIQDAPADPQAQHINVYAYDCCDGDEAEQRARTAATELDRLWARVESSHAAAVQRYRARLDAVQHTVRAARVDDSQRDAARLAGCLLALGGGAGSWEPTRHLGAAPSASLAEQARLLQVEVALCRRELAAARARAYDELALRAEGLRATTGIAPFLLSPPKKAC
eukprot:TRINITY_DN2703_c0_g1_i2.p1 TRINITY_DN2703_c0_g1~~TRINITY_DN2703_c0_g1_i2.p1  ORF type:complete len:467 (-),score=83.53 TRINITY_DN2703_c0_g1_i2:53-1453(-)